ncbi:sulfotransferase [Oxynema aestuarii]|uniref:Sulfotransferase n=1 Tax=Oxynema aestuarii AP17 TaxID=2064643 RepID=A0A6H1TVL0_9CYAN|nr:sulfotransferase [Oxynema aestuarii]QIZ69369.1 sulfotransferase [Oxynema aestuarii AP17]
MYSSSLTKQTKRLRGAIQSHSPAARLGILSIALSPITRSLDRIAYQLFRHHPLPENWTLPPCAMIVSPPRSGSTIVYQVLTRIIPSVYISNLHSLFPSLASSYLLKNDLFGKSNLKFNNYYGYTSQINDVNEGNQFIEQLLQDSENLSLIRSRFIRLIRMMQATRDCPFIFKNVRAYPKILKLHNAIPELNFIRVKRNPEQVIQSVVRAYYELGTFHPVPPSLKHSNIKDPVEFAIKQILEIEKTIDEQLKYIKRSSWVEVEYEAFCSDPWIVAENLLKNYLNLDLSCLRKDALSEPLKVSNRVKVSEGEAKQISFLLKENNFWEC